MKSKLPTAHACSLVVIDGVRTPFCKMGDALAPLDAVELGKTALQSLLLRSGFDPALVDETLLGCVSQPADAANLARVAALRAGIPETVPAMTVHRNCASGIEALALAADRMAAGRGSVYLAGGTESMSRIPMLFSAVAAAKFSALARRTSAGGRAVAASRFRPSDFLPLVGLKLGLTDPVSGLNMGETAELLARELGIPREEQDAFALRSHLLAAEAPPRLAEEIAPVYLPGGAVVESDDGIRPGQSSEALARLRPVFERGTGTVTAGNSSQLTDGAAVLLATTLERAEALGLEPLGRLVDYAVCGCEPERMGLGPAYAIRELHRRSGFRPEEAELVELNEAFAAQVLAVRRRLADPAFAGLELPMDRLNPNGGAIALGHPVGASGARLVLAALKELRRRGGGSALVSLCVGGGQGVAALFESLP